MACLFATAEISKTKKQSREEKQILRLYAGLEKISKSDEDPENPKDLENILTHFQNFFNKRSRDNRFHCLFSEDILNGIIKDQHRGISPKHGKQHDSHIHVNGDSLLFRSMSIPAEKGSKKKEILDEINKLIVEQCPQMMIFAKGDKECKGISPLHFAILKEDINVLETMEKAFKKEKMKETIKEERICAVGTAFQMTAMMAGTLLGVASLKFNKKIFCIVLENFAFGLDDINEKGDNIVHSFIKYAHVQPDKMDDALEMLQYIMTGEFIKEKKCVKRKVQKLLMMTNKEKLLPLQLAAKRQQYAFFEYIMQHEVYRSKESSDGIYSEEVYDITEIETLGIENEIKGTDDENIKSEYHESVLEYIVNHQTDSAFRFADFLPVREVIKEKWQYYRWWFWCWFAIHLIFMGLLSVTAVYRSKLSASVSKNSTVKYKYLVTKNVYVTTMSVAGVIFGISYLALDIARHKMSRFQFETSTSWLKSMIRHFTTPYSNFLFRIYFALFYLLLLIDFFVALLARQSHFQDYQNNFLIFAVMIGWYLFMFFLQGFQPFSFFTVLIQRVILDMLRFAIVMLIFLVAFSIAMFMIMQGADTEDDDFNHFGKTMLKMLTIMLGLGEIEILFQARQPILAITVFVLFVCFTTILLLNALIALMSNSCTDLMSNSGGVVAMKMHCRLQKLSVVLFLESFLPRYCCKEVGAIKTKFRYENNEWLSNTKRRVWSLSSQEDSIDPVHNADQQSIADKLIHRIRQDRIVHAIMEKKTNQTQDFNNTFHTTPTQSIQRHVDITVNHLDVSKTDGVAHLECQEIAIFDLTGPS